MIDLSNYDKTVFNGAIDVALIEDPNSRLHHLWVTWKKYIDYFVVANEHIKRIMFFNLMGVILTHKGYGFAASGNIKRTTRLHYFIFQRSRSGKGEAMKAKSNLIHHLGIPTRYAREDNAASAVGTCQKNKDGTTPKREGHLRTVYDYNWDEGSVIIREKKSGASEVTLTDILQGVMDDPGQVSKGMAWGDIEYPTNASMCAGSYIFDEMGKVILSKGFFQRMVISYKIFNEEEKRFMRGYVPLLKNDYEPEKVKKLMANFKKTINEIPEIKGGLIPFNKRDTERFVIRYDMIYDNIIANQFADQRTQEVLESFSDMVHLLVDKIAAQSAIIDGKKEVTYKDMLVALPVIKIHIASVLDLFNTIEISGSSPRMRREQFILNVIKVNQSLSSINNILSKLDSEMKKGKWDVGRAKNIEIINGMVERGVICKDVVNGVDILKINA